MCLQIEWSFKIRGKMFVKPTWFEHAAFWSGVRHATIVPRNQILDSKIIKKEGQKSQIWYKVDRPSGMFLSNSMHIFILKRTRKVQFLIWLRGAMVARLTPDQKAACSNHVGVNNIFRLILKTHSIFKHVQY